MKNIILLIILILTIIMYNIFNYKNKGSFYLGEVKTITNKISIEDRSFFLKNNRHPEFEEVALVVNKAGCYKINEYQCKKGIHIYNLITSSNKREQTFYLEIYNKYAMCKINLSNEKATNIDCFKRAWINIHQ